MSALLSPGTWRRSADVAVVDHEDRVVALDLNHPSAPPVVLEGTAATIWHLLADADTEARLVAAVAETFNIDPAAVREHVHAFLLQLNDLGLVTRSGG